MANIFDYLTWRGDLDFNKSPFNPVDNIILSQLAYLTLDGIIPGLEDEDGISIDLAIRVYNEKLHSPEGIKKTSFFKDDPKLINALAVSKRFGKCHLFGYENHIDTDREIQFAAVSIYTSDCKYFIAYRGTDISVIGWKENLNMCFKEVIPSQLKAVEYLEKIASLTDEPLRIGGHSKGGNLAIYAASHCDKSIQKRIIDVYSNDAPGFHEKVISHHGFLAIKDRIRSFVPQSSIIGMFLKHGYENKIIKSSQSGLMQHELYSWDVTHNDLVYSKNSTISSRYVNKTLREWIDRFDTSAREQFIEALYHVFSTAEVKSIHELEVSWFPTACRIIKSLNSIDIQTRKLIRQFLAELFRSAGRNIDTFMENKNMESQGF
jgi:predicted esterase